MIYDSTKKFPVFIAGEYEVWGVKVTYTVQDLQRYADNYNLDFKKSPLTIDHLDGCSYGWIKSFEVIEDTLFMCLDELDDEMLRMNAEGKYRYPSIEFTEFADGKGNMIDYIRAVTMTNFNKVKNLPMIKFSDEENRKRQILMTENISINFSTNQNQKNSMSKIIIKFAEKIGITTLKADSDENAIVNAFTEKFTEAQNKITELNGEVTRLSVVEAEFAEKKPYIAKLEGDRVETVLTKAFSEGKGTKAEIEAFRDYTEKNYDKAVAMFAAMPVKPALLGKLVNTGEPKTLVDISDPKFTDDDGNKITYQMILDKPELIAKNNFSEDDIKAIRGKFFAQKPKTRK